MSEPQTVAGRFLKAGLMQLLNWPEDAAENAITDIEAEARQPLREMLDHLQWHEVESGPGSMDLMCPWCQNWKDQGHAEDCELAALIRPT